MKQAILLDTNVLSELMRPQPDVQVLAWFDLNNEAGYYTSAVTQAEILLGISLLPPGKRQTGLADAAAEMFSKEFSGRCLPFDEQSAEIYMKIVIYTNNIAALRCGSFAAFGPPGLSIFILRCARAGHGGLCKIGGSKNTCRSAY
jgi:hypothetical protein